MSATTTEEQQRMRELEQELAKDYAEMIIENDGEGLNHDWYRVNLDDSGMLGAVTYLEWRGQVERKPGVPNIVRILGLS